MALFTYTWCEPVVTWLHDFVLNIFLVIYLCVGSFFICIFGADYPKCHARTADENREMCSNKSETGTTAAAAVAIAIARMETQR